jgi:hypothetical protein
MCSVFFKKISVQGVEAEYDDLWGFGVFGEARGLIFLF